MIHKITIENYYSLRDEITLDFKIPKNAPELNAFYKDQHNERYPKVIGVFGHNASGKTNVVKALAFLRFFVLNSHMLGKDDSIPVSSFSFCPDAEAAPIKFNIEYEVFGEVYEYKLCLTSEAVISEELRRRDVRSIIFKRKAKSISSSDKSIKKLSGIVSEKSSLLSFCFHNSIDIELLKVPIDGFSLSFSNMTSMGRDNITSSLIKSVLKATDAHFGKTEIKNKAIEMLSKFDLGLCDIRLEEKEFIDDNGKVSLRKIPFVFHRINGTEKKLFIGQESNGTQSLYVLILDLLETLYTGGVAIIDEIDAYLHSHMLKTILDLFYDDDTNPHGAQLIFTGHADYIMTFLEKEQIILVEKDEECVTDAYLLKEVKGVRRDDNIREKYHAGAYGGIPEDNF